MSVIALTRAERRFDERTGVGPVDFTSSHAEFVSIVGPSGCGKSVLVDMIGGLEHCDRGAITIDGARVHGPSPDRQIVFQDGALFPWLTVEENVAFGLRARGDRPEEIEKNVDAVLQTVQLERVAHLYPRELAASMRQRTAIARALVLRPPVLLLDDPFAALDEVSRARMQLELSMLWSSTGATAVLVTHSVPEACLLSDRVLVLSNGPGRVAGVFEIKGSRPRAVADVANQVDEIGGLLRAQAAAGGAAESESLAGTLVYRSPRRRLG